MKQRRVRGEGKEEIETEEGEGRGSEENGKGDK